MEATTAEKSGEPKIMITAAPGNAKCMKSCMEDTVAVINYLRDKGNEEDIEDWQLAGAEAMLNKCKEDGVIPYDLLGALMVVFRMWDKLEEIFKN